MTSSAGEPGASDRAKISRALGLSEWQLEGLAVSARMAALRSASPPDDRERVETMLGLAPGTLEQRSRMAWLTSVQTALPNGSAHLLPPGVFQTEPASAQAGSRYRLAPGAGALIASDLAALCARTPLVIDYEHATLSVALKGGKAPAAGWIVGAEWIASVGLVAQVAWTDRARERITSGEFKHASPVILSTAGEVTGVALAALVRQPAIANLREVQVF